MTRNEVRSLVERLGLEEYFPDHDPLEGSSNTRGAQLVRSGHTALAAPENPHLHTRDSAAPDSLKSVERSSTAYVLRSALSRALEMGSLLQPSRMLFDSRGAPCPLWLFRLGSDVDALARTLVAINLSRFPQTDCSPNSTWDFYVDSDLRLYILTSTASGVLISSVVVACGSPLSSSRAFREEAALQMFIRSSGTPVSLSRASRVRALNQLLSLAEAQDA